MSWLQDTIDTPLDELVSRNSPELLAHQLQTVCKERLADLERHHAEKGQIAHAFRRGLRAIHLAEDASRAGRKTLRVTDVLGDDH